MVEIVRRRKDATIALPGGDGEGVYAAPALDDDVFGVPGVRISSQPSICLWC